MDGIQRTIVVDDYVPFHKVIEKEDGDEVELWEPAFAKSSKEGNEIWMALIQKAYAKMCGSYEAMENQEPQQPYQILVGGPCEDHLIGDYHHDINRGESQAEKLDKMYQMLE